MSSGVDQIASWVAKLRADGDGCANIYCAEGGREVHVQVAFDQLNTLNEELSEALQASLRLRREDKGLYDMPDGSPAAVAELINTVMRRHFGFAGEYSVRGDLELW